MTRNEARRWFLEGFDYYETRRLNGYGDLPTVEEAERFFEKCWNPSPPQYLKRLSDADDPTDFIPIAPVETLDEDD